MVIDLFGWILRTFDPSSSLRVSYAQDEFTENDEVAGF